MVKKAKFTSVWDDGYEVTSECKVNMESKEVFDIELVNVDELDLEILEREYITIDDKEYPVSRDGEDDTEFWYS